MTSADIYSRAVECAQLRASLLALARRYTSLGTAANGRRCRMAACECEDEILALAAQALREATS